VLLFPMRSSAQSGDLRSPDLIVPIRGIDFFNACRKPIICLGVWLLWVSRLSNVFVCILHNHFNNI
jgi:hypothetical protein